MSTPVQPIVMPLLRWTMPVEGRSSYEELTRDVTMPVLPIGTPVNVCQEWDYNAVEVGGYYFDENGVTEVWFRFSVDGTKAKLRFDDDDDMKAFIDSGWCTK